MCKPDNCKEFRFYCEKHDALSDYGCDRCKLDELTSLQKKTEGKAA